MVTNAIAAITMRKIQDISTIIEQQQQQNCRVCDRNPPQASTPAPPGPRGFLDGVTDERSGACLTWPADPKVYMERHARIATGMTAGGRGRAQPARAYAINDPALLQNGLCAGCQERLHREYRHSHTRPQALLRWALATHAARAEALTRYAELDVNHPDLPDDLARRLATAMRDAARKRAGGEADILPDIARHWARRPEPEAVIVKREIANLPLRVAAHCTVKHQNGLVAVLAILPDPDAPADAPRRHAVWAGTVPYGKYDAATAGAGAAEIATATAQRLAGPVSEWLPEYGSTCEHLYLHPADYGSKRIVPGKARRQLEQACGEKLFV